MVDVLRQKLCEIVSKYPDCTDNPKLLEALLNDSYMGEFRREQNLLLSAVRERVVADLANQTGFRNSAGLKLLAQRLTDRYACSEGGAAWAVSAWAEALGISGADHLKDGSFARVKPFRLLVIGNFRRGRSSIVNALLGEEILTLSKFAYQDQRTEIKFGKERKAVIYFSHIITPRTRVPCHGLVRAHIQKYCGSGAGTVPPLEVPPENLNDYLVMENPANVEYPTNDPIDRMEICLPNGFLEHGFEIVKIPLTYQYPRAKFEEDVRNADAVIFVMSCDSSILPAEMHIIEHNLIGTGMRNILFIMNKYDLISTKNREKIFEYHRNTLSGKTDVKAENGIFYLSSGQALNGFRTNDSYLIAESRIRILENALIDLLNTRS